MIFMKIKIGCWYILKNLDGRNFGKILIVKFQNDWMIGSFKENLCFQTIKQFFNELEEAANNQLISIVDELNEKIDNLNLYICSENDEEDCVRAFNIQIMNNSDICFKNKENSGAGLEI